MEKEKLCLRCMRKIGDNNVCPYCQNEESTAQESPFLPLKTVVGGKYLIGKLVANNGDGSTYYAFNLEEKKAVTIREFFPEGLVTRGDDNYCLVNIGKASQFIDEKTAFAELWNKLLEIGSYSALPAVYEVFEDKGTVYAVSEYFEDARTLREYLLETEQGYILWDEARVFLMPVLAAVGALHRVGIIHGGISPTTIIIDKNGKARLTGFSVSDVRIDKGALPGELYDGYAAIEQYTENGRLTPVTDIYAFAGVLYRTLVGSIPIDAPQRVSNDKLMIPGKFAEVIPAYVINALVNALQILPGDRTPETEQMRDELSASPAAAGTAAEAYSSLVGARETVSEPSPPPMVEKAVPATESDEVPDSKKLKKSTIAAFAVSAVLCLAILVVVFLTVNGTFDKDKDETTTDISTSDTVASDTTAETKFSNLTVPNFVGQKYDDVVKNADYAPYLTFISNIVDSDKPIGQIISQDISEGNVVTSINKRKITLKVSRGLKVPDVEGKNSREAKEELEKLGFKNVNFEIGVKALNASQSNTVKSVVYVSKDSTKQDWADIPADGYVSADDKIILYCYGEYSENTTEPSTEPVSDSTTTTTSTAPDDTLPDD